MALSVTWGGVADTDVELSSLLPGDMTVAVRFLAHYDNVYAGPLLAVHGSGTFWIGTGDAFKGKNHLAVRIGSGSGRIESTGFAGRWVHVAVVVQGGQGRVHVGGTLLSTFAVGAGGLPVGTLRLGRSDEIHQQFYGLLDDVAVFDRALDQSAINQLATGPTLTGTEPGLVAGYVFGDGPTGPLPSTLTRKVTLVPGARTVTVSADRNAAADRARLPLSLVGHMRLPFPPGQEAKVVQGFADASNSHHGYAAFCYDFVYPDDDIDGDFTLASAPGTVDATRVGGPNSEAEPPNVVTIRQADHEFCDYLHVQQGSALVKVGDAVSYRRQLALVGRSGTKGPHLHQAVTNLGETTTDRDHFVTIPLPYCNYDYSEDEGDSWHRVIRGYPGRGQWVRNPPKLSNFRCSATWVPGTVGEQQMFRGSFSEFKQRYDDLWPHDWRLWSLSTTRALGGPQYTAVWRKLGGGEWQVWDRPYAEFQARYDELWKQDYRLRVMSRHVTLTGEIRYAAAWAKGTGGEMQQFDVTYEDFQSNYDELWKGGWRLNLLDIVTVKGVPRYSATWIRSNVGEFQVFGGDVAAVDATMRDLWPKGYRITHLATYGIDDRLRISAVWRKTQQTGQIWVADWQYEDLQARYDVLWQRGWRLGALDAAVV